MRDARGDAKRPIGLRLWLSGGWLILLVLAALLAPWIAPQDPLAQDLFTSRLPPFWEVGAEPGYWLGSDSLGRDVLSRIIHGARLALIVALVAGTLTCVIGTTLGLIAGYYRGWPDRIISRFVDIWMAFPPVLFAILLIAVLGTGLTSIIIAIVVIDWTRFARVIRAEAMTQGAMDYVASARVAGRKRMGTMLTEILPNVLPTIIALLTLEMGIAVIVEAILSFVNLSISTDSPTWGGMISEGRTSVHQAWWVLVFPLITLFLTVLSFSQLGEGLKDRFDPVLR
ncbi:MULTISPECIES: ABC transporter permease [Sulfitobacter]|uniref:Glutathione transport system permease protein GsiD n=1 Tax=Sulfitobacter dubius TaxID=218673 RepID=A0ABY3ZR96_9RHOB|nr:ABC transporter permease [Sulfitobacter dubius]UOA16762.1 Glutathione transport system permease protein GsiD [Sulfitobacter dubius]WOI30819.1 ABC transporter permease [Sulfitobacter dubius]